MYFDILETIRFIKKNIYLIVRYEDKWVWIIFFKDLATGANFAVF